MKLPLYKEEEVVLLGEHTIFHGSVANKMAKQMHVMINLYTNPFIFVQELASNAYDAHVESGQTKPIVIDMSLSNDGYTITFSDWGPGMDPERIKLCYSFLESTKEENNNQIGGEPFIGDSCLVCKFIQKWLLISTNL